MPGYDQYREIERLQGYISLLKFQAVTSDAAMACRNLAVNVYSILVQPHQVYLFFHAVKFMLLSGHLVEMTGLHDTSSLSNELRLLGLISLLSNLSSTSFNKF